MDYGRWSDRIFTKKPRVERMRRQRERAVVPTPDKGKVTRTKFRNFVKNVFRGRVKT